MILKREKVNIECTKSSCNTKERIDVIGDA